MEYKGKLQRWNDEKGFGFIAPENARQRDIFIHISALTNTSRRPVIGDVIFYHLYTDSAGKVKAINARIDGVSFIRPSKKYTTKQYTPQKREHKFFARIINTSLARAKNVLLMTFVVFVFTKFSDQNSASNKNDQVNNAAYKISSESFPAKIAYESTSRDSQFKQDKTVSTNTSEVSPKNTNDAKSNYQCDGRQHCSQMSSCAEAEFFSIHCPDTKMDGDGDGKACEDMCGH